MKLAHHYRTLGLVRSASFTEVKSAYRRLVRQYHPDLNPDEQAIAQFIAINEAYTALSEAHKMAPSEMAPSEMAPSDSVEAEDGVIFRRKAAAADRLNLDELKLTLEKLGLGNFQKKAEPTDAKEQPSKERQAEKQQAEEHLAEEQLASEEPTFAEAAEIPVSTLDSSGTPLSEIDRVLKQDAYKQLKALLGQQKFPRAIALVEGLSNRLPTDPEISQWRAIVYQRWGRQLINEGQLQKARIYLKKATQVDPNNAALSSEIRQDLARLDILKRVI